jgi:Transcriptional regulators
MKSVSIDQFGFLLHDAARLLRRRFEMRGSEYGLSAAQWRALARLVKFGPMPQARLADLLEIEPISVSRLIDRMEQAGWVTREADETDRRAKLIVATEKSKDAFSAIKAIAGDVYENAMTGLSEAERTAFLSALATVVENLSDSDGAPPSSMWTKQTKR